MDALKKLLLDDKLTEADVALLRRALDKYMEELTLEDFAFPADPGIKDELFRGRDLQAEINR